MDLNYKTYANTFIYSRKNDSEGSMEQTLLEYILKADRIDKSSEAFKPVLSAIKTRQTTSVLYRMLLLDEVVLCMYSKELPASFKVFTAKDLRTSKKGKKIFVDVTGLVQYQNGYFSCKEIDKLCAYLLGVLVNAVYYVEPARLYSDQTMIRNTTKCYVKMFVGILDYLRLTNYADHRIKIAYIVGVYYLYTMMGKDISTARNYAASILAVPTRESTAYDIYYDYEKDFQNIDTFVKFLTETFKLKGLTTDVLLDRWIYLYGKGTMYGTELLPAFIIILTNAYSGSYINHQKKIESTCGKEMVEVANNMLRIGAAMYDKGFKYESSIDRDEADREYRRLVD